MGWERQQSLLPYFFLAAISQANISFLQADQAWSLDWDVLGLREPGRCPQNTSPLCTCSAQSNLPGTTVSTCRPTPKNKFKPSASQVWSSPCGWRALKSQQVSSWCGSPHQLSVSKPSTKNDSCLKHRFCRGQHLLWVKYQGDEVRQQKPLGFFWPIAFRIATQAGKFH